MSNYVKIYALIDPESNEVRYVGKTKVNPSKRLCSHINEKRETRKCRWIRKLQNDGKTPNIKILEETQEEFWEERERFWIAHYRNLGCDLTNHTDGGDGVHNPDEQTRKKISLLQTQRLKDQNYRDKVFTKERSLKISESLKGKKKTLEHVAKLKQNQPGGKLTREHREKISKALIGNQYRKGIKHTDKVKELLRIKSLGNKSRTGQIISKEERLKRSLKTKGIKKSEEHKEKIRQGQLKYWSKFKNKEERRVELFENRLLKNKQGESK